LASAWSIGGKDSGQTLYESCAVTSDQIIKHSSKQNDGDKLYVDSTYWLSRPVGDAVVGILSQPRHEEDVSPILLVILGVVSQAAVHDQNAALGQLQRSGCGEVMGFTIGDRQEAG
jgi:hypothetical protein